MAQTTGIEWCDATSGTGAIIVAWEASREFAEPPPLALASRSRSTSGVSLKASAGARAARRGTRSTRSPATAPAATASRVPAATCRASAAKSGTSRFPSPSASLLALLPSRRVTATCVRHASVLRSSCAPAGFRAREPVRARTAVTSATIVATSTTIASATAAAITRTLSRSALCVTRTAVASVASSCKCAGRTAASPRRSHFGRPSWA